MPLHLQIQEIPMKHVEKFLTDLDQQIQEKHLLKHPFYQAWSKGMLKRECLIEYAKEYYPHVRAFPTYLSALHSHIEDMETRIELLQNLIEEEAGKPNHPELWKTFALSLGASEEELTHHTPCEEIQLLIEMFRSICREGSVVEGLASLYAYESQIPAICLSKIEGLKAHYGFRNPRDWRYFSVHIHADQKHAKIEKDLLAQYFTFDCVQGVRHVVQHVLDGLWNFLSQMCNRHKIAC
jgi:pyrroloquinoline-quinone synthase